MVWCPHPVCGTAASVLLLLLLLLVRPSIQAAPRPLFHGTCKWGGHGSAFPLDMDTCPPPVDESAADWKPWTHRPHCINKIGDPTDDPQFCIFSDASFRFGRGISVLTSPEVAAAMVGSLDDAAVSSFLRDHPSSPFPSQGGALPPYRVMRLPGRGKGTIATRKIKKWETVLVDFPAVITQNEYSELSSPSEIRRLLERGVEQLPEHQKDRVLSLAHATGGELIRDILRTNVFGGIEYGGVPHVALFPIGSRVNHNCRPNTFWRFDPISMAQEVVAMRDIEKGEEISHSYTALGLVSEERKRMLDGWGFECTCDLCALSQKEKELSDGRRERLQIIHMELSSYGMDRKRMDELVEEMTYLIEAEQIWPLFCEYYVVTARAYLGAGDLKKARQYTQMAEDTWVQYGGTNHENVEDMKLLWRQLTSREDDVKNRKKRR